ncbi:hypothetical protein D3C80_725510 [compost metagenome]
MPQIMPVTKRCVRTISDRGLTASVWVEAAFGSGNFRNARMAIEMMPSGTSAMKAPAKVTGASRSLPRIASCGPTMAEMMPPARIHEIAFGL